MPRYFIHIHNGLGDQTDETGTDFTDARIAVGEAAKTAGEILCDEMHAGLSARTLRIVVEDADHTQAGEIAMSFSPGAAK